MRPFGHSSRFRKHKKRHASERSMADYVGLRKNLSRALSFQEGWTSDAVNGHNGLNSGMLTKTCPKDAMYEFPFRRGRLHCNKHANTMPARSAVYTFQTLTRETHC